MHGVELCDREGVQGNRGEEALKKLSMGGNAIKSFRVGRQSGCQFSSAYRALVFRTWGNTSVLVSIGAQIPSPEAMQNKTQKLEVVVVVGFNLAQRQTDGLFFSQAFTSCLSLLFSVLLGTLRALGAGQILGGEH